MQALWDGPALYLLFRVSDPDITTSAATNLQRSGVQIFVDQYDDKFPKFEEDDGYVIISAAGQQTGNRTNAGLMYYPAVWSTHLQSFAASVQSDVVGKTTGYTIELGWHIGDRPLINGTMLGMEFAINVSAGDNNKGAYQLYWSSGNSGKNGGTNDNIMWGEVLLSG